MDVGKGVGVHVGEGVSVGVDVNVDIAVGKLVEVAIGVSGILLEQLATIIEIKNATLILWIIVPLLMPKSLTS